MRHAVAVVMFLVSAAAGLIAFGLYRLLQTPPPGAAAPPSMTDSIVLVGSHSFTPVQVIGTLSAVAIITGIVGIVALVAGPLSSRKSSFVAHAVIPEIWGGQQQFYCGE
jgi:hypothetical protein